MANEVEIVVTSTDRSGAGIASAKSKIADLKADAIRKIDDINQKEIKLRADMAQAEAALARFKAKAEGATGDVKAKLELDIASAEANLAIIARKIENLPNERKKIEVDTADAIRKIDEVDRKARDAARDKRMSIVVDTSGSIAKIGSLISVIASLAPVAIAAAGALAGIGAVGIVGFGSIAAGFNGIGDALKAMGEEAKTGGGAVVDNSAQIRAATQGVVDARRNLEAATLNVADAEANLSLAQEQAERAQADLNVARQDAIRMLEDYALRSSDMALRERGASLSVAEAEKRLSEVRKSKTADSLDIARAELSLDEARQRQKQTLVDSKRLSEDKAVADQKGVEKSDQMVAATDRFVAASRGQAQAERAVNDARLAQTRASEQLAEAQTQLAESMKKTGAGAGGVDKVAEAMKKLTPAGREFVTFMKGFIDGPLKKLGDAGQQAFLPGIQAGMQKLPGIMKGITPAFANFSKTLGQAMGDLIPIFANMARPILDFATASLKGLAPLEGVFRKFGAAMAQTLDELTQTGAAEQAMGALVQVIDALLPAIPLLIGYGTKLMAALGPSLAGVIEALVGVLEDVLPAMESSAPATEAFLTVIAQLLDPLGKLIALFVELNPAIPVFTEVLGWASKGLEKFNGWFGNSGTIDKSRDALGSFGGEAKTTGDKTTDLADSLKSVSEETDRVRDAQSKAAEGMLGMRDAENQYQEALDKSKEALAQNGKTVDVHSEKGRANRKTLDDQAKAARDLLEQIQKNDGEGQKFAAAQASMRSALIQTGTRLGMTKADAEKYADAILKIPASKTTTITANVASALAGIASVKRSVTELKDKTVTIRTVTVNSNGSVSASQQRASSRGGRVPGAPSMVDTESYLLAQGEYVVNSRDAQKWMPWLEDINAGRDPSPMAAGAGTGMRSAGGGGGGGGGHIVLEFASSGSAMDDFLIEMFRRAVRVRGGDVQVVLGNGAAA